MLVPNCILVFTTGVLITLILSAKTDATAETTKEINVVPEASNQNYREKEINFYKYLKPATDMDDSKINRLTKNFKSTKNNIRIYQKMADIYPQLSTKLVGISAPSQNRDHKKKINGQGLKVYQGSLKNSANFRNHLRMDVKGQPLSNIPKIGTNQAHPRAGINLVEVRPYYPEYVIEPTLRFVINKHFTPNMLNVHCVTLPTLRYTVGSNGLSTVCIDRSTIYNKPKVKKYLKRMVYDNFGTWHRPVWLDLRWELFTNGNSEECHTMEMKEWKPFLECNLRRHQRMEYMIPMYPLHQMGYYYTYSRSMNENDFTDN